ncbi:permease prefix domain 1-containing protein [Streptomyces sp. NBC_00236]|uniref:permease prefix domain 1-containing protein n=1 Tax=unclassified Streptomyces TaxID=2593676 RepID=UPI002E2C2A0F|nr:permease prefix domain 1-containing protein [Streptomyces sp. NBC_00236]
MSSAGRTTDPVEEYVTSLESALHGPARARARLVEEVRDGLTDSVAEYAQRGLPYGRAAAEAVREFGSALGLVESCQRELTIAQARHTARRIAMTAPFLVACWYLVHHADQDQQVPRTAQLMAAHLAGVALVATLLVAVALAATGTLARRLPTPDRLPRMVGWAGTTASVSMAVAALALATASALATNWSLTALAGALAAASHGWMAGSVRACRACARLPVMERAVEHERSG